MAGLCCGELLLRFAMRCEGDHVAGRVEAMFLEYPEPAIAHRTELLGFVCPRIARGWRRGDGWLDRLAAVLALDRLAQNVLGAVRALGVRLFGSFFMPKVSPRSLGVCALQK